MDCLKTNFVTGMDETLSEIIDFISAYGINPFF
jgi:hypothetical protein